MRELGESGKAVDHEIAYVFLNALKHYKFHYPPNVATGVADHPILGSV